MALVDAPVAPGVELASMLPSLVVTLSAFPPGLVVWLLVVLLLASGGGERLPLMHCLGFSDWMRFACPDPLDWGGHDFLGFYGFVRVDDDWECFCPLPYEACDGDVWFGPCPPKFLAAMEELDFVDLGCQDDAVRVQSDGVDSVIFWTILFFCINERTKVAVGRVGFVRGSKVRLPAVEEHCIARFIFLFSYCLRLNCCGLTAINEVNSLGLRRQHMENCERRENSITLSLLE